MYVMSVAHTLFNIVSCLVKGEVRIVGAMCAVRHKGSFTPLSIVRYLREASIRRAWVNFIIKY